MSETPLPAVEASDGPRDLPSQLLWLVDAPMFIDERQVEAFYDAVVRPDYEGIDVTLAENKLSGVKFSGNVEASVAIPWLGKGKVGGGAEAARSSELGQQRTLRQVSNVYRHLLALALHYATKLEPRVLLASPGADKFLSGYGVNLDGNDGNELWSDSAYTTGLPRALAFFEFPECTAFIPVAMELESGQVKLLYDELENRLLRPEKTTAPKYPGSSADATMRDDYWRWFAEKFRDSELGADTKALQVVEEAAAGDSIAWIAYRVPIGAQGEETFLHLHVAGRGEYDTGTFAYNLIKRGFKHGMRMVGTLKSEPDMNVLAIFER